MDVVGGGVPQVDAVYLSTGIQIMRHSWFGDIYVDGQARVGFDLIGVGRYYQMILTGAVLILAVAVQKKSKSAGAA